MGELWKMSKIVDRYCVLQEVLSKTLTQLNAAEMLDISERQVRNLLTRLNKEGRKGIIPKEKGGNNRKPEDIKRTVLSLIRERYEDFGPTLAQEKLEEIHHLVLSVETLRRWMIEGHIWIPRGRKRRQHLPRPRKECFGEMIQADGSHHHWFGEEQPRANATVFIDDATSMLTSLVFSQGETLESYFEALEKHLKKHGRPRALYTDRYSIFQSQKAGGKTQMQKALEKLDIRLILANTPQAKGKVERANRTLQDRLIKELRLRGIKTIEEANHYAEEFIEIYNRKFSKRPMKDIDAHRPLEGFDLERILCRYEERILLSDHTFQFNKTIYKVQEDCGRMKGKKVEIRVTKGKMRVFMKDKEIQVEPWDRIEEPPILTHKELYICKIEKKKPAELHPWKRYAFQIPLSNKIKKYERL